jgi:hypothetical protein
MCHKLLQLLYRRLRPACKQAVAVIANESLTTLVMMSMWQWSSWVVLLFLIAGLLSAVSLLRPGVQR